MERRAGAPAAGLWARSGRWLRATSVWAAITALAVVGVVVAGVIGVRDIQAQITDRTLRGAVQGAQLINSLVVQHNISGDHIARGALDAGARAEMDSDVVGLQRAGELIGLEVWTIDHGALLYTDPTDPHVEATMPADELARARRGVFTQFSPEAGQPLTVDVFIPHDADGNGSADAVVEVLLPREPLSNAIVRSTRLLYGGAAAVAVFGALVFWASRRRRRSAGHAARHDGLTGLGNWSLLVERAEQVLATSGTSGRAALLVLDVNGFRQINETLGHQAGDDLLVEVARRLRAGCRRTDTVIRTGGDKFAILASGILNLDAPLRIAHQLREAVRRPVTMAGLTIEIDASVGVAVAPEHGTDLTSLSRSADIAMYEAKRDGSGVSAYDPRSDPREAEQLTLLGELRRAIGDGQLRLHYQPQCRTDGRVGQVEALIRWQHPERGLLSPDAFVPLAERTTLIKPLTTWVLDEATRQCAAWRDAGCPLRIAVNISPRNLIDDELPPTVFDAAVAAGIPITDIQLEVTETAVMLDPRRAARTLTRLSGMGVSISIDDFGAGYTSLSLLSTLPVDSLKIDQRFIRNLLTDAGDQAIVRNIIQLAHDLDMITLAEGVETAEVWSRLIDLGCDEIQGYLLTRPLPPDQLIEWITDWRGTPRLPAGAGESAGRPGTLR